MHYHGHSQPKLSRKIGPRRALLKSLVDNLILYEKIETTEMKAKALAPYFERLVTKAKKKNLHNNRQIFAATSSHVAAQKLIYELVDGFKDRHGGYTRIIKIGNRRGDNAPMAVVELVLPENFGVEEKPDADQTKTADNKAIPTKSTDKAKTKADQPKVQQKAKTK